MTLLEGTVTVDGNFAYVAQQAWILNATLRDNILFGKDYEEERWVLVPKKKSLQFTGFHQKIFIRIFFFFFGIFATVGNAYAASRYLTNNSRTFLLFV